MEEHAPQTAKLTGEQRQQLKEMAQQSLLVIEGLRVMLDQCRKAIQDGRRRDATLLTQQMCDLADTLPGRSNAPDWLSKLFEKAQQRPQTPQSRSVN